ncbi:MAG: hypothetical protein AAF939_01290 [Planctomycetota bacterium]
MSLQKSFSGLLGMVQRPVTFSKLTSTMTLLMQNQFLTMVNLVCRGATTS